MASTRDRVNIPEATARYRVQRLLNSDLLQLQTWADPNRMAPPQAAIINLTVEARRVNAVAQELDLLELGQFLSIFSEWEVELRGILVNPDGRAGGDRDDGSRQ
ncbi:MAG: hypothetical protein ACKO4L_00750 [Nodosilinea sp.]